MNPNSDTNPGDSIKVLVALSKLDMYAQTGI